MKAKHRLTIVLLSIFLLCLGVYHIRSSIPLNTLRNNAGLTMPYVNATQGYYMGAVELIDANYNYNGYNITQLGQYPQSPASYLIWVVGGTYYAKNGETGVIDYAGANVTTVAQSAIDALMGTEKGAIVLNRGVYNFSAPIDPSLAPNFLTIKGIGKATRIYTGDNAFINTSVSGSFLELKDFYLRAPATSTSDLIVIDNAYGHVSVLNVEADNLDGYAGDILHIESSTYETIVSECSFNYAANLIYMQTTSEACIVNNKFSQGIVDIRTPYSIIEGNIFEHAELGLTDITNGWWVVSNNIWSNNTGRCIDIQNSRNGIIHDNVIREFTIDGSSIAQGVRLGWGHTENVTVHDNIIRSSDGASIGIREQDSGVNYIHHNNLAQVVGTKMAGLNPKTIVEDNIGYEYRFNATGWFSEDYEYRGDTVLLPVGEAISAGNLVYIKAAGTLGKADADGAVTMPAMGIALEANSSGTCLILTEGYIYFSGWTLDEGDDVYVSTTAGGLTVTAPNGSGDQIQVIGLGVTEDLLYFSPDWTLLEVT